MAASQLVVSGGNQYLSLGGITDGSLGPVEEFKRANLRAVGSGVEELRKLQEKSMALEQSIEQQDLKYTKELKHLNVLIKEHKMHLSNSFRRHFCSLGSELDRIVECQLAANREEEVDRQEKNLIFLSMCKTADKAARISSFLMEKKNALQKIWELSIRRENLSREEYSKVVAEGAALCEEVVRTCARKNVVKVAQAAAAIHCAIDQHEASVLNEKIGRKKLKGIKTLICLRPIIPTPCLMPFAFEQLSSKYQRGYDLSLNPVDKSVVLSNPRRKQVINFSDASLHDLKMPSSVKEIFRQHVEPILLQSCQIAENGAVFSCGSRRSGKFRLLFGAKKRSTNLNANKNLSLADDRSQNELASSSHFSEEPRITQDNAMIEEDGLIITSLKWLLNHISSHEAVRQVSCPTLSVYEMYNDKVYDLLDFSVPLAKDPKDMKEIDRLNSSVEPSKAPREVTIGKVSSGKNTTGISEWEVIGAKCVPIESIDLISKILNEAISNLSQFRKRNFDWSTILVDIQFVSTPRIISFESSHRPQSDFAQKSKQYSLEPALTSALKKNPHLSSSSSPVRIVFCKLPGTQRFHDEKDSLAVRSAKKSLSALTDVLVALKKLKEGENEHSSEMEKKSIEKIRKHWKLCASLKSHTSLSQTPPMMLPLNIGNRKLFGVPVARNGKLVSSSRMVTSSCHVNNESGSFIPFRNNKLTQLLSSSLLHLRNHLLLASLSPCTILETSMPPTPECENGSPQLLREAYLRFGQQAQEVLNSASYTLQFIKKLE